MGQKTFSATGKEQEVTRKALSLGIGASVVEFVVAYKDCDVLILLVPGLP